MMNRLDENSTIVGAEVISDYSSIETNTGSTRTLRSSSIKRTITSSQFSSNSNDLEPWSPVPNYPNSRFYDSEDDDDDESVDLNDYNKSLRILTEELFQQRSYSTFEIWLYKVKSVLSFSLRTSLKIICLPIYWIIVEMFIFEKWILNRRKAIESRQPRVLIDPLAENYFNSSSAAASSSYHSSLAAGSSNLSSANDHHTNVNATTASAKSVFGKLFSFLSSGKAAATDSNNHRPVIYDNNDNSSDASPILETTRTIHKTRSRTNIIYDRSPTANTCNHAHHPVNDLNHAPNNELFLTSYLQNQFNSIRNYFNTSKTKSAGVYHNGRNTANIPADKDGGGAGGGWCGPCSMWWLLLLVPILLGCLWPWMNYDVMKSAWMVDHLVSKPDVPQEELDLNFAKISSIPSSPEQVPPSCPPVPSPVPVPDKGTLPNSARDEQILVAPILPPKPIDSAPTAAPPEQPAPIPSNVPIGTPAVAPCTICPSPPKIDIASLKKELAAENFVDIPALKRELTQHFTELINQQCVTKCDCSGCDCKGGSATTGGVIDPDDIDKKIQLALAKYDADKTGLPDLALEPGGGSVVNTRCTKHSHNKNSVVSFFGIPLWSPPNNPRVVIQPGLVPGECWSFDGSIGYIVIKLAGPSYIAGFSLEHISKSISPHGHIKSAPKNFQVVGMMDYNDPSDEFIFGDYIYEDNGQTLQYFKVQNEPKQAYQYVELKISSNHGNIEFTCLYRFRVHGNF